jgi:hypothetical protein
MLDLDISGCTHWDTWPQRIDDEISGGAVETTSTVGIPPTPASPLSDRLPVVKGAPVVWPKARTA